MSSTKTRWLMGACLALASAGCDEPTETPEPTAPFARAEAVEASPEGAEGSAAEATPPRADAPRSRAYEPATEVGVARADLGLAVGAPAPDATVATIDGSETTLASHLGEGTTMLVFYRGGWCPYCNFQIRELTENHASFVERGVSLVLVSVDRIEESARTSATYEIPFAVLSDADLAAHRAFRVLQEVDAPTLERLQGMGIDLEAASGRDHHTIAVPSVFLIRDGVVVFRHVEPDYRTRPSVPQLLAAIDGLAPTAPTTMAASVADDG